MPLRSKIFAPPRGILANNSSAGITLDFIDKICDCSHMPMTAEQITMMINITENRDKMPRNSLLFEFEWRLFFLYRAMILFL